MTNEQKAKEYAESKHKDKELQKIVAWDFVAGAEWKEQQMIDKAVEWLKENTSCYASFDDDIKADWENKRNFIEDFKQAMKKD